MQIYELPVNELKIIVKVMFDELKGNIDTQWEKIRKIMYKQNKNINKEIELIKKNQMEILLQKRKTKTHNWHGMFTRKF